MNFKKTAIIAATAGALAAISVPAMALENEFHGMYRLRGSITNFQNANAAVKLADEAPTTSLFEQRARLQYTAKANDDLKLVTHFEIDSSWGDSGYDGVTRGEGGRIGADGVNLETKNVYLDFKCPLTGANFKAGIQPIADAYKGIFLNADAAGILASKSFGNIKATAGFSRLVDYAGDNPLGRQREDLYLLDANVALSKDLTVGGSYYLVRSNSGVSQSESLDVHMLGVNAAVKAGIVSADAFLAYQGGSELNIGGVGSGRDLSAFAAQAAVKVNLDKAGIVHANLLYTTGGKSTDTDAKAWQSLGNGTTNAGSENSYYESKMMLLMRSVYAMDSDKALVSTSNNGNHGVTLLAAGYDTKFSDKLSASANLGYAMYSEKDAVADASIGTEINAQIDYKMYTNLSASFQAAYVILGDGASKTADDPYLTALMLSYTF